MSETNQPHFTNVLDSFGQPLLSDEIPQQEIVEKSGFFENVSRKHRQVGR